MQLIQIDAANIVTSVEPTNAVVFIRGFDGGSLLVAPDSTPITAGDFQYDPVSGRLSRCSVDKLQFARLFTNEETVRYNALRRQVNEMVAADYESSDPAKQLLVALEIVFAQFDRASRIELGHPETVAGVDHLRLAGVLGGDEVIAAERVAAIRAGTPV